MKSKSSNLQGTNLLPFFLFLHKRILGWFSSFLALWVGKGEKVSLIRLTHAERRFFGFQLTQWCLLKMALVIYDMIWAAPGPEKKTFVWSTWCVSRKKPLSAHRWHYKKGRKCPQFSTYDFIKFTLYSKMNWSINHTLRKYFQKNPDLFKKLSKRF